MTLMRDLGRLSGLSAPFPALDRDRALQGLAGDVVRTLEPHTEAHPAGLLVSFLVDFGCLMGRGPHVMAGAARHGAHEFALLVGETSRGRKGTTDAEVRRIMAIADQGYVSTRRMSGFVSGEAFIDEAAHPDDKRLLVTESEFVRLLRTMKGRGNFAPLLRQAWDGSRLEHRSRSGGKLVVDDAHIACVAHITASELRATMTTTELGGGLLNRFLVVAVDRSKVLPFGGDVDPASVQRLGTEVASAAMRAAEIDRMTFSDPAARRWTEAYQAHAVDSPDGLLGFLIARDDAHLLRLSVIYALLDGADEIELPHLEAAQAVWQYCRDSTAYLFGSAVGDAVAERLLDALRSSGRLTGMEQRDLFAGHVSAPKLKAARSELVRLGLASEATEATAGRPTRVLIYGRR